MIPPSIITYLDENGIPFQRRSHPRAVTAQELAAALHVTGFHVAKSVIVNADGKLSIAVCPAPESIDLERLGQVLGARHVELADEDAFSKLFPDCEVGAEPPFGRLYGLPVVCDESLRSAQRLLLRAGSHEEAVEMRFDDFLTLESPKLSRFIEERLPTPAPSSEEVEARL
jgi:Ala-tRNA(Pro) deacylase